MNNALVPSERPVKELALGTPLGHCSNIRICVGRNKLYKFVFRSFKDTQMGSENLQIFFYNIAITYAFLQFFGHYNCFSLAIAKLFAKLTAVMLLLYRYDHDEPVH